MRTLCAAAALLALMQPAWVVPSLANSNHPLDALTEAEITTVKQTLADAGYVTDDTRFPALTLAEPEKSTVLGWSPGDEVGRSAFVTLRQGPTTHEAIVDLDAGEVTAYREVEGVQSNILLEEWETALTSTTSSPEWQAAMGKRGYDTFDNLFCAPLSTGWFGDDQDKYEGARILKVPCFDTEGADNNLWARPIEGLYTVVDLISGEVIDVVDNKVVPVATEVPRYADGEIEGAREPLKPIEIAAPQGPNYERDGGVVEWQDWSFHVRVDRRVGPVLSLVSFQDQGEARSIAYQITMAEMFVPYMDPSDEWYFRSYMDIGEYGFGLLASQLQPGIDCPDTATFINATLADDMGEPFEAAGIVCLFERNTGDPNWRHAELINQTYQGRPEVELVLRMIPTVGNYDYVIDYVFRQRGQLAVNVGATGIDATKGVETAHMSDETAEEDTRYGELVAPNVVAVYHDHYISFRIDLDVDGTENSFVAIQGDTDRGARQPAHLDLDARRGDGRDRGAVGGARPGHLAGDEPQQGDQARAPSELSDRARTRRGLRARPGRLLAAARLVLRSAAVADHLQAERDVRRRRLSEPVQGRRRPAEVRGRRGDREHRPRRLVHRRLPPRDADRGLAGAAHQVALLQAAALQLLRPEPGARRADEVQGDRRGTMN